MLDFGVRRWLAGLEGIRGPTDRRQRRVAEGSQPSPPESPGPTATAKPPARPSSRSAPPQVRIAPATRPHAPLRIASLPPSRTILDHPLPARRARMPRKPRAAHRRRAAAVLEVLAGVRTPAQAAEAVGVSLPRYYLLEQRAIGGLVAACEPAPRGPQANAQRRVAALEREIARLTRESGRHQALARAAQRTLGLAPPTVLRPAGKTAEKAASSAKARRRRRPAVRALTLAEELSTDAGGDNSSGVRPAADVEHAG